MKKRLNTEGIENELRGGSAFFPNYETEQTPAPGEPAPVQAAQDPVERAAQPKRTVIEHSTQPPATPVKAPVNEEQQTSVYDTMLPRHHDTTVSRNHDTMIPPTGEGIYEVVRKAIKQIGKEAATHRFTIDEKNHLADIEYTYKRQGIKASENEITRIAINYFIEEYRTNGEQSILAKILKRLNS
jgi:hypothetical protein